MHTDEDDDDFIDLLIRCFDRKGLQTRDANFQVDGAAFTDCACEDCPGNQVKFEHSVSVCSLENSSF